MADSEQWPGPSIVLGRRLRRARHQAGLTQASLAQGIVSTAYVSRIEHGDRYPSRPVIEQFARRLGLGIEELEADDLRHVHVSRFDRSRARILLSLGEYPAARRAVDQAAQGPGTQTDENAVYEMIRLDGLVCLAEQNTLRARALLEWLADRAREVVDIRVSGSLCKCYVAMRDWERAIAVGQELIQHAEEHGLAGLPESTEGLYWYYQALLARGEVLLASNARKVALQTTPSASTDESLVVALFAAADLARQHGRIEKAAQFAERAEVSISLIQQAVHLKELSAIPPEVSSTPTEKG